MPKSKQLGDLNHLQRYLVEEYVEDYQEGAMTRRQALKYIAAVIGSLAAANTVLAGCVPAPMPSTAAPTGASAALTVASVAGAATAPASSSAAPTAPALTAPPPTPAHITALATQAVLATLATVPTPIPQTVPLDVRVPADDPAIEAARVTFPGDGLTVLAYQARPKAAGPFGAILVCHENRGLTDYAQDVARRVAKAGYVALAVDLLSSQGGTDKIADPAQIPATLSGTSPDALAGYFLSGISYLEGLPFVAKDRLGMVGFCFGGGMTWLVATKAAGLKAAVPFYGPNPPLEAVPGITAAVLALYGGDDARINAGIPAIEAAMQQHGKTFEKVIYPGAAHAFHNDTGRNYQAEAALDAWNKTLAWFKNFV